MFHKDGPTLGELVRQALSSTDRGYDLLAEKFDRTPFRTPDAILEPAIRFLAAQRGLESALDVCCGTGAAMRFLRPTCRGRVVGVDRSIGMLRVAEKRLMGSSGAAVELVRGDALALPYRGAFDLATCFGALGHIESHQENRFVASVRRTLKPGGRFAMVTGVGPPLWNPRLWIARGFNAAMRVRNALIDPPFVMYYLTFLLPDVRALFERNGFSVELTTGLFEPPFQSYVLMVGTKE